MTTTQGNKHEPLNNCLDCKYFSFDGGSPGYSEYTPGSEMTIGCRMGIWHVGDYDNENTFRANMLTARECKYYEPILEDE